MSHTAKRIIKNTFYILSTQVLTRILATAFIIFSTRILGAKDYGIFVIVNTIILLSNPLINLGVKAMIVRKMLKEKEHAERIISNVLFMRIIIAPTLYLLIIIYVNIYGYSDEIKRLVYIAGLVIIFNSIVYTFETVFLVFEKMKQWGMFAVTASLLVASLSIASLLVGGWLQSLFVIKVTIAFFFALSVSIFVRKNFFKFRLRFEPSFAKELLLQSLPFFALLLFEVFNKRLDIIMLSFLDAPIDKLTAIGFYAPAHNILLAMMILPLSLNRALLPIISQKIYHEHDTVIKSVEKATKFVIFTISFPIIIATTFFSPEITRLLFGTGFTETVPALMILGWGYAFFAMNIPAYSVIGSKKEVKMALPLYTGILIINIVLNLLLIPKYSYIGASVATCASMIFGFLARFYFLRGVLKTSANEIKTYLKFLSMLAIVLIFGFLIRNYIGLSLLLISVTIAYIVLLFLFRVFDREEKALIKNLIKKSSAKNT